MKEGDDDMNFDQLIIKGMNENKLKNLDLSIPKNKITVFTSVSGSGKVQLYLIRLHMKHHDK